MERLSEGQASMQVPKAQAALLGQAVRPAGDGDQAGVTPAQEFLERLRSLHGLSDHVLPQDLEKLIHQGQLDLVLVQTLVRKARGLLP